MVLRQGTGWSFLAVTPPAEKSKKPTMVLAGSVRQGDSKDVTVTGSNLSSIKTFTFEAKDLTFELVDKRTFKLRLTEIITAKPGDKQMTVVLKDDTTLPLLIPVRARSGS